MYTVQHCADTPEVGVMLGNPCAGCAAGKHHVERQQILLLQQGLVLVAAIISLTARGESERGNQKLETRLGAVNWRQQRRQQESSAKLRRLLGSAVQKANGSALERFWTVPRSQGAIAAFPTAPLAAFPTAPRLGCPCPAGGLYAPQGSWGRGLPQDRGLARQPPRNCLGGGNPDVFPSILPRPPCRID